MVTSVAIAGWLVLAWANGKGSASRPGRRDHRVRLLHRGLRSQASSPGDAAYAPAAPLAASCTVMAIGIAAVVLLLVKQSWPYYADHATAS